MPKKSNKRISVVVVTFRVGNYLKRCLSSIQEHSYPGLEIIVIDNSLKQDSGETITRRYDGVQCYHGQPGLSYCEGLNIGIKIARGEFILCLNDDVILAQSFFVNALKGFAMDSRIGMVSGKILRFDKDTIDSAGLFLTPWRTAQERGYGLKDRGQFEKEGYVYGISGAVAFYRKKMLDEIKQGLEYFDRDYHYFYEDLDMAWRSQKRGWKGYYIPSAIAYHVRGASLRSVDGRDKPYARRYLKSDSLHVDLIKNRYLTIIKNESIVDFLWHFPFILFYDIIQWGYIVLCKPQLVWVFLKNWSYVQAAFKKRKKIIKNT